MKKNIENKKLKIVLITIMAIILAIGAYIYIPHVSYALSSVIDNIASTVGKITIPENAVTMDKKEIQEHRGYGIWAKWASKEESASYDDSAGNTGITNITSYIESYLSPYISISQWNGWLWNLQYGTSIFCQESGQTFPSLNGRKLFGFHLAEPDDFGEWDGTEEISTAAYIDVNEDTTGKDIKYVDFTELIPDIACESTVSAYLEDYKDGGIVAKVTPISEKDILDTGAEGWGFNIKEFMQKKTVRVRYTATPRDFDTIESFIFTYSLRNWYTYNPAQYALWKYKNDIDFADVHYTYSDADSIETGRKLYEAAMAVNELTDPTKPQMEITTATEGNITYSTGTVLDGDSYKVGPIKMNSYSYGWTENIKGFAGESSVKNEDNATLLAGKTEEQIEFFKGIVAGIIEAKVKLDNGTEIILDKDNMIVENGTVVSGSQYYSCPTMEQGYEYPTPGSTFYIKLPVAECKGATKVEKITMKYKWYTADGNGGDLDGVYDELTFNTWKEAGKQERLMYNYKSDYYCTNTDADGTPCIKHGRIRSAYAKIEKPVDGAVDMAQNDGNVETPVVKGEISYNLNAWSHYFTCGLNGWCQYGSSSTSTKVTDDPYTGTKKYTDEITDECTSTWACGKPAHQHDSDSQGYLSDYQKEDGTYEEYCECTHYHSSSCFTKECDYDDGELTCSKGEHSHGSGCYTEEKDCNDSSANHVCGSGCYKDKLTCDKKEHSHSNSCYHWCDYPDYGAADGATSCYSRNCGHKRGTTECADEENCCKHEEHWHVIGECGKTHGCEMNYCTHGFENGEHKCSLYYVSYTNTASDERNKMHQSNDEKCKAQDWGDDHIGRCYGEPGEGTYCVAHGIHRNCMKFHWYLREQKTMPSQRLMYVSDAQVYEHNEECYLENIPLVAKVEIDKYVYDVEHSVTATNNLDTTYKLLDARRDLEEEVKKANPVYVETDDLITYKIMLKNSSAFGVKVRVDDIMPECDYEFVSAYVGKEKLDTVEALREKIIQINATSEALALITIKMKENPELSTDNSDVYENRARIITRNGTPKNDDDDIDYIRTVDDDGPVVNHIEVQCNGTTEAPEWESSDWVKINNYNAHIDKFVYKYDQKIQNENNNLEYTDEASVVDGQNILLETRMNDSTITANVSDGNVEDIVRQDDGKMETFKKEHPLNAEKGESITYAIKVSNEARTITKAETTGDKPATQFKPTLIIDTLHEGLQYDGPITATIYNKNGSVKRNVLGNAADFTPVGTEGDYNIYNIEPDSSIVLNPDEYIIFYVTVKVVQSNMYLYSMENTAELKDISNINDVIVTHRNISNQQTSTEYVRMKDLVIAGEVWLDIDRNGIMDDQARSELDKTNNNINDNAMKNDILVRLYQVGVGDAIRTTRTDENGLYTFGRDENLVYHDSFNYTDKYSENNTYQRVDKADNKDGNGNYKENSKYLQYYIEYEYDGVLYKSTEIYAGMDNLTGDGKYNDDYLIDSNARELIADREAFNTLYEYISYDVAYDMNLNKSGDLVFQKDGHQSLLMEDSARAMTAKSFVNDNESIEYLWLYQFEPANNQLPETDYLKHINLGLELREDVDLALTKDLYKIKTTINGEQMEYDYNLNDGINGEMVPTEDNKYLQNYITGQPYGFEIYESDYKYRFEQYLSQAVQEYKGINGEDELNVEVTFRMTINNVATTDDDEIPGATDTKLDVKVHEVMDLYDQDFMEIQFNEDGTMKVGDENEVDIKVKDENGYLIDGILKVGEAWYYDDAGNKVDLTISNKSSRGANGVFSEKENNFRDDSPDENTRDGYNTIYITGMGNEVIPEDGSLDIFVKYVLDKDELQITITDEEVYTETNKTTVSSTYTDGTVTVNTALTEGTTETTKTLARSLKIAENITTEYKTKFGKYGTEGIAQINAYSVWYEDGKPASLVDKDSNAGNIGIKNTSTDVSAKLAGYSETMTSADDIDFYEDITYKTGVQIVADYSENDKVDYISEEWFVEAFGEKDLKLYRDIKGTVWDDSRSESLGTTNKDVQYIGNGLRQEEDSKLDKAKSNGNVDLNYKDASVTEEKDIAVRNAKAEFIEIVSIPQADGTVHDYEQVLTDVTWKQVQHKRTNENGEYTLKGLKPGNYIVRFTYGDTVEENVASGNYDATLESQKDMLVFNGQDYKSTQYTLRDILDDNEQDVDTIIEALEQPTYSDARDDEVRRLEVNAYSEVMTNNIAEILKGVANGTKLTPNSSANSIAELKELTENTYMEAETKEFLIKAEKLTAGQTVEYRSTPRARIAMPDIVDIIYQELEELKNQTIKERDFTIENVDFGIEYRPESEISLLKEIDEISLTTEDNEILVDLFFNTEEGPNGTITHSIDKTKSVGFELVQFISNDYASKALLNNLISEEDIQGLAYIQVDEEILQGCTVKIVYRFDAQNNSEVDRISKNLDDIRYKENEATVDLIAAKGADIVDSEKYTASGTGRNVVYKDTYDEDAYGFVYRNMKKVLTGDGTDGYFGRYAGYAYYEGEISDLDTVASLKFDKILDYIDKGLEYEGSSEQEKLVNKFWTKATPEELVDYVYKLKDYRDVNLDNTAGAEAVTVPPLTDVDGNEYSSLVLSIDDRRMDEDEYLDEPEKRQKNIKNSELSRFLVPKVTVMGEGTTAVTVVEAENKRQFSGTISLEVSKVLAANTADDDMTYENIAEIVQFTTLNGRRTNFATTIGNADIHRTQDYLNNPDNYDGLYTNDEISTKYGSIEYVTARLEPDTSATETVTLMPPTGVMLNRRALVGAMRVAETSVEVASVTGLVVAIIAVIVLAI